MRNAYMKRTKGLYTSKQTDILVWTEMLKDDVKAVTRKTASPTAVCYFHFPLTDGKVNLMEIFKLRHLERKLAERGTFVELGEDTILVRYPLQEKVTAMLQVGTDGHVRATSYSWFTFICQQYMQNEKPIFQSKYYKDCWPCHGHHSKLQVCTEISKQDVCCSGTGNI